MKKINPDDRYELTPKAKISPDNSYEVTSKVKDNKLNIDSKKSHKSISPEEQVKDVLSPIAAINKDEINKKILSLKKDPKLLNAMNDLKNKPSKEILDSRKMKAYGGFLKKEIANNTKKFDTRFQKTNFKENFGTWALIKDIRGNSKYKAFSKNLISSKEPDFNKRIIYKTTGDYIKHIAGNYQSFAIQLESQVCKIQGYKHVGQEQNVDGYCLIGNKEIPVQIKTYFQLDKKTDLGSSSSNNKDELISEEWRYWFYNNSFQIISKEQIDKLNDSEICYVVAYPRFLTNKRKLLSRENMTIDVNISKFTKENFKKVADNKFKKLANGNTELISSWDKILKFEDNNSFLEYGLIDAISRLKKIYKKNFEMIKLINEINTQMMKFRAELINGRINSVGLKLSGKHNTRVTEEIIFNY